MRTNSINKNLIVGSALSFVIAVLHLLIIIGGPDWYRFFGAGEGMAQLAETDSPYPILITLTIALVFFMAASYGFSGAGIISKLPFYKSVLFLISAVYLFRGVFGIPLILYFNNPYLKELEYKMGFMIISSVISIFIGSFYIKGTIQLSKNLKSGLNKVRE